MLYYVTKLSNEHFASVFRTGNVENKFQIPPSHNSGSRTPVTMSNITTADSERTQMFVSDQLAVTDKQELSRNVT
jgi:hypothetical protein